MSQATLWILIAISSGIAIFLLIYNLKSWKKLKNLNAEKVKIETQQTQALYDSQLNAAQSIKHIAQFMVEEQVELTEGCIRIKVLLDHVAPQLHEDEVFNIFSIMYKATEHMPTHQARKDADKKLIKKLDLERFKLEAQHKDRILDASNALLKHSFQ